MLWGWGGGRPALYDAYHEIHNLDRLASSDTVVSHIVGPICESGEQHSVHAPPLPPPTPVSPTRTSSRERFVRFLMRSTACPRTVYPALVGAGRPLAAGLGGAGTGWRAPAVLVHIDAGDVLGVDRVFPKSSPGDLVLIANAGAYGRVMSSQYNMRELAEEVVVDIAE
jgi:hypothetical protein